MTEEYASVMALCGGGTVPCGLISKRTELHMAFFRVCEVRVLIMQPPCGLTGYPTTANKSVESDGKRYAVMSG
jgi:hypothetical protein